MYLDSDGQEAGVTGVKSWAEGVCLTALCAWVPVSHCAHTIIQG